MTTKPDFQALAAILDASRDAKVSDAHWESCKPVVARNAKRLEEMEKAASVTPEMINRPFTI